MCHRVATDGSSVVAEVKVPERNDGACGDNREVGGAGTLVVDGDAYASAKARSGALCDGDVTGVESPSCSSLSSAALSALLEVVLLKL